MSLTVIISHSPDTPAATTARSYCLEHQEDIQLIFFFDQGVMHACVQDTLWQTLATQHNITLNCCIDSIARHLESDARITPPFIVSGMGTLAASCDNTTQTVMF